MDTKKNENKFIMRGYRSCVYSAMCEMIHSLRSTSKKNILVYSVMAVLMASLSTWMLFLTHVCWDRIQRRSDRLVFYSYYCIWTNNYVVFLW